MAAKFIVDGEKSEDVEVRLSLEKSGGDALVRGRWGRNSQVLLRFGEQGLMRVALGPDVIAPFETEIIGEYNFIALNE